MNWNADVSPARMSQSLGIMVNYVYDMSTVNENSHNYSSQGKIQIGESVKQFLVWIKYYK